MKVSTKRAISGVSAAAFIAALHWAAGFDFDERGITLFGAFAAMALWGFAAAMFPFDEPTA